MGLGGVWDELFWQEMTGVIESAESRPLGGGGMDRVTKLNDKMSVDGYGWPSGE